MTQPVWSKWLACDRCRCFWPGAGWGGQVFPRPPPRGAEFAWRFRAAGVWRGNQEDTGDALGVARACSPGATGTLLRLCATRAQRAARRWIEWSGTSASLANVSFRRVQTQSSCATQH
jgi:hypothetical protein